MPVPPESMMPRVLPFVSIAVRIIYLSVSEAKIDGSSISNVEQPDMEYLVNSVVGSCLLLLKSVWINRDRSDFF